MDVLLNPCRQPVQQPQHPLREWSRRHDALLCLSQAGGGDHLHRLGDLLRRLDRANPAPKIN